MKWASMVATGEAGRIIADAQMQQLQEVGFSKVEARERNADNFLYYLACKERGAL